MKMASMKLISLFTHKRMRESTNLYKKSDQKPIKSVVKHYFYSILSIHGGFQSDLEFADCKVK